jgi:hypothetical protein
VFERTDFPLPYAFTLLKAWLNVFKRLKSAYLRCPVDEASLRALQELYPNVRVRKCDAPATYSILQVV